MDIGSIFRDRPTGMRISVIFLKILGIFSKTLNGYGILGRHFWALRVATIFSPL